MTIDTKKLAEFAAEFFAWVKQEEDDADYASWYPASETMFIEELTGDDCILDNLLPYYFFEHRITAPILAHLAKREMEKRGIWYQHIFSPRTKLHWFRFKIDELRASNIQDGDYFIALWSAIEASGKK